jgi:hypothetical protein
LPRLPKNLENLYCYGNMLNEWPTLPHGLKTLVNDNVDDKLFDLIDWQSFIL